MLVENLNQNNSDRIKTAQHGGAMQGLLMTAPEGFPNPSLKEKINLDSKERNHSHYF